MKIEKLTSIVLLQLFLTLLAQNTLAATCDQSNLKGTWHLYGHIASIYSDGGENFGSVSDYRCKVKVSSSGSIIGSSSSCKFGREGNIYNKNITGGSLKVSSNCNVTGKIKEECVDIFCDKLIIEYGTMARDKNTFTGIINYDDPYERGTFNAVKR